MRYKLLKIANDLNKLILHSDEKVRVYFQTFSGGEVGICVWHFLDIYKYKCERITFYESHTVQELQQKFELAKKVIAGECLIDE